MQTIPAKKKKKEIMSKFSENAIETIRANWAHIKDIRDAGSRYFGLSARAILECIFLQDVYDMEEQDSYQMVINGDIPNKFREILAMLPKDLQEAYTSVA